jgi:hypothetical protein
MTTRSRRAMIGAVLVVVITPQGGCRPGGPERPPGCDVVAQLAARSTFEAAADTALDLLACPLATDVPVGDPVLVFVAFQNTGRSAIPVRARLLVEWYLRVDIEGPGGEVVSLATGWEPGVDDRAEITLPRGGLFGRVVGLACEVGDYRRPEIGWEECWPLYRFDQEGLYRISISYEMWCGDPPCPSWYPWTGTLEAPPFEVRVYRP